MGVTRRPGQARLVGRLGALTALGGPALLLTPMSAFEAVAPWRIAAYR